jgi:hypothetical protein
VGIFSMNVVENEVELTDGIGTTIPDDAGVVVVAAGNEEFTLTKDDELVGEDSVGDSVTVTVAVITAIDFDDVGVELDVEPVAIAEKLLVLLEAGTETVLEVVVLEVAVMVFVVIEVGVLVAIPG